MDNLKIPEFVHFAAYHAICSMPYTNKESAKDQSSLELICFREDEHHPNMTVQIYFRDEKICVLSSKSDGEHRNYSAMLYDHNHGSPQPIAAAKRSFRGLSRTHATGRKLEELNRYLRAIDVTVEGYQFAFGDAHDEMGKPSFGALMNAGCTANNLIEVLDRRELIMKQLHQELPPGFLVELNKNLYIPLLESQGTKNVQIIYERIKKSKKSE